MVEKIAEINGIVQNVVWGVPALALFIGVGLIMTIILRFFQFTRFNHAIKNTIGKLFGKKEILESKDHKAISQFQALCTALSATIGTGNIVGIAYAITMSGPGAVFWMWIAAVLGMMTGFSENVLGIYYRKRNNDGQWCGGAMYTLEHGFAAKGAKGLGKLLAKFFAVFTLLASFGIGNLGQFVSISENVASVMPDTEISTIKWVVGICVIILSTLVIIGGLKRIATTNEKIVPFMSIFYIGSAAIVICLNYDMIIPALKSIVTNAFGANAIAGGVGGSLIANAIQWGFKRGVFSNEAGLGSSVIVHTTSDVKEPVVQGFWSIFEVFFDTIIICTITALVILTSGVVDLQSGTPVNGSVGFGIVTEAYVASFGSIGGIALAVAVFLFAFSTMLGWSFYGVKAWEYLWGSKSTIVYKIIYILIIFVGILLDSTLILDIADTFNGLMAIPNLISVLVLSDVVYQITRNYEDRKFRSAKVRPMLSYFDDIQIEHENSL